MKKNIIVIAYMCGWIAALCASAVRGENETIHFENKERGYSFDFLKNWTKIEHPMEGFDVAFVRQVDGAVVNTSVLAGSNQLPKAKAFEDAAQAFIKGFSTSYSDYELLTQSDTRLDTAKAIRFLAKAKLSGVSIKLLGVVGTIDGKFVFALISAPTETSEKDFKIFDDILVKSFKFDAKK